MVNLGTVQVVVCDRTPVTDGTPVARALADACVLSGKAQDFARAIGNALAHNTSVSVEQVRELRDAFDALFGRFADEGSVRVVNAPIQGPIERPAVPEVDAIELQLSIDPALATKYGKRIKMAGGSYTDVRGYVHRRIVTLPNSEEGRALANKLIVEFPYASKKEKTTVIMRTKRHNHSTRDTVLSADGVTVEQLLAEYSKRMNAAIDRGEV